MIIEPEDMGYDTAFGALVAAGWDEAAAVEIAQSAIELRALANQPEQSQ